jgi:phytoene/squalene synthetase
MVLAARLLGAEGTALDAVRGFGVATGLANFLRALPDYRARGRDPLPAGLGPGEVARAGLAALARARAARGSVPPAALPALLPGWLAPLRLRRAVRDPAANLEVSEFRARAGLLWTATTGRW